MSLIVLILRSPILLIQVKSQHILKKEQQKSKDIAKGVCHPK